MSTVSHKKPGIGLRRIFFLIFAVTLIVIGSIIASNSILLQRKTLFDELQRRGGMLAEYLARSSVLGIVRRDSFLLRELTRSMAVDPDIAFAEIIDPRMTVIARTGSVDPLPVADKSIA